MDLSKFTFNDLEKNWEKEAFACATISQINKDFAKFNLKSIKVSFFSLEKLTEEVRLRLMDFMQQQSKSLPQLAYTIDLPQAVFQELMSSLNFYHDLSELIIRREALKVYFRRGV